MRWGIYEIGKTGPIHIIPEKDTHMHIMHSGCRCNPEVDRDLARTIIIHNAFDGRDIVEDAERIISR